MSDHSILSQADDRRLQQAAADNHQALFSLSALNTGGEVCTEAGVTWTFAPKKRGMICFPALTDANAAAQLDKIITYYLHRRPRGLGCWSLAPAQPAHLDLLMLARGFQTGWRPCWMALDLSHIIQHPLPEGLVIKMDNTISTEHLTELPYSDIDNMGVTPALLKAHPEKTQRFIALSDGEIVAHSAVFFTDTAGIYNVGVLPVMRNRGIGKAIVLAACNYAKELGYRYAVLNATGRRMYEQVGFRWTGSGYTWWAKIKNLRENPPAPALIALAEAIGRGKLTALQQFDEVPARNMTNGMTWMELAVHFQQQAAARWLISKGVRYTVLDAWKLNWPEEAAALLAAQPSLVNERYGEWGLTLLHIAADHRDTALARLALSANPDLTITDTLYNSTALNWSNHLHAYEVRQLIEAFQSM